MRLPTPVRAAVRAALSKKASDVVVLDVRRDSTFTDFFVLASAGNQKQIQAIAEAVQESLLKSRLKPRHMEGYPRHEWILLDYSGFVVHVFSERMRAFYDLERLWGGADRATFE